MVTLNPSAAAEDRYINTWHFLIEAAADRAVEANLIDIALTAFYNAIDANMSSVVHTVSPQTKHYDLSEPEPRTPFRTASLGALTSSTGPTLLPPELSVVLTYQANTVSGQSQRRRRGRIYCGPWSGGANTSGTGRPLAAIVTSVASAADALKDTSLSAPNWKWVVYSRVSGLTSQVTNGWVDDEWDIQRRRGLTAATRTLWS